MNQHIVALFDSGQFLEVVEQGSRIPGYEADPDLNFMIGESLAALGDPARGIPLMERSLSINPFDEERWKHYCERLSDFKQFDKAIKTAKRRLRQTDDNEYNSIIGFCRLSQSKFDQAIYWYKQCLDREHFHVAALNNLGNAYRYSMDIEKAINMYRQAIAIDPSSHISKCNLISSYQDVGDLDSALAVGAEALRQPGVLVETLFNYSLALLSKGNLDAGWELYKNRKFLKNLGQSFPKFSGQHVKHLSQVIGRRVLVHHEQGLGDTIQFCRYLPILAKFSSSVHVIAPWPLHSLLRRLKGVSTVSDKPPLGLRFEYECAMLDLPMILGTNSISKIPNQVPYLPITKKEANTRKIQPRRSSKLKVGIVWAGEKRDQDQVMRHLDLRRSLTLDMLRPVLAVKTAEFYSLQFGERRKELADFPNIQDLKGDDPEFLDTALAISKMDLIVTVDTSVAHLAGAMGRPVWMMSRFDACWRWFQNRPNTPWYPTMVVYGQPKYGDWDSVIQKVAQDLARISAPSET